MLDTWVPSKVSGSILLLRLGSRTNPDAIDGAPFSFDGANDGGIYDQVIELV